MNANLDRTQRSYPHVPVELWIIFIPLEQRSVIVRSSQLRRCPAG